MMSDIELHMRYYKFLLVAPNNYLHPIERDILPNYELKREALLHLDYICDGSGVLVYRMRDMGADMEQAEEDLKNHSMVIDYDVFDVRDDIFHLYVWFKPGGSATKLMSIGNRYGLIIEPPFYFNENGHLEV
ncbi:MAG: hypothetical protein SXQ77_11815, partial [Halobacteria archaeon]|nr:hypothetical protein [Halobacteria archaeon]